MLLLVKFEVCGAIAFAGTLRCIVIERPTSVSNFLCILVIFFHFVGKEYFL